MTTKIKWRLGKLPDPSEISLLLKEGVLTKDEAREILFSQETEEDRDKKSLQEEIKFLRQLVQSLSTTSRIVEHIHSCEKPYRQYPWWNNYQAYCANVGELSSQGSLTYTTAGSMSMLDLTNTTSSSTANTFNVASAGLASVAPSFTDIKTF